MTAGPLADEVHKRLTLNWLIQGAAQHAGMTLHHLVRHELDALDPRLVPLYDQYALVNLLQYWRWEGLLLLGWPPRFWRRARTRRRHPFYGHPVLSPFGGTIAAAARARGLERAKDKGLGATTAMLVICQLRAAEAPHRDALTSLAKRTASAAWGIPVERLDARMSAKVALGPSTPARTFRGAILRAATVGVGGVVRRDDRLVVVARGTNWQLLTKELVKGTAELVCLHGLNTLDDDDYRHVVRAADWLEYEPWMLQSGGELWRRLAAVLPLEPPVATILMRLARLSPASLHALVTAVIEQPEWARELLAGLAAE